MPHTVKPMYISVIRITTDLNKSNEEEIEVGNPTELLKQILGYEVQHSVLERKKRFV